MPDPVSQTTEAELRQHVEHVLRGQYDVEREIGRGGMGIVYRARDLRLKRPVAIKLLPPELAFRTEIRTRFLREAETAAQLNHPNIVPIYSVGDQDNLVFFVMAFVDGKNLARRIHDEGRLSPDEVRRILIEVSDALGFAHARRVIHRDIKPDNILLDADHGRAMVTDFGIARAVIEGSDSRLTATGMAIGTPAYMSPEQCAGDRDIDGRSDLYGLGVVAYQMLTGEVPFRASSTPALLMKQISEPPVPIQVKRPDVPEDLARAVMMLLEKDPDARFPNAEALVAALRDGVLPAVQRRPSPPPPAAPQPTAAPVPAEDEDAAYVPTPEELRRWDADPVRRFRRKLAPYIAVNAVILVFALVGGGELFTVTMIWTMYMAYQYARLWSDGYDWRDVFRQPRHRELLDVTTAAIDDVQALFDKERRQQIRQKARRRRLSPAPVEGRSPEALPLELAGTGNGAEVVTQARKDRDAIAQILGSLPRSERERLSDVGASADALLWRVQALAVSVAELERSSPRNSGAEIEEEIALLEAQANPLDRTASEGRVRRLAMLKRQRRSVAAATAKLSDARSRLESCSLALQNMRFDMLRLKSGTQSPEQVTHLAMQAMQLAREVDHIVSAAAQVRHLTASDDRLPQSRGM